MPIDVHALYVPKTIVEKLEVAGARYGLSVVAPQGTAWHRLLNESLGGFCAQHPGAFSWLASGPLPRAALAARELEYAVRNLGAVGAVVAANVDGANLGELPGVLDRFPRLQLILSHGGGAVPYLIGRFDVMHERGDRAHQGLSAEVVPTAYLRRMYYDSIVHSPAALKYLASMVRTDRIVIGTDESFPPADRDPLGSLARAGFSDEEIRRICEDNPRALFPGLK